MSKASKAGAGHSRTFFDLIRAIGEAKSKQDEDKTIMKEIALLKQHIGAPNMQSSMMRELLIRVVYCEMLGHPAEFGYIRAVKLMPSSNLLEKRVGYLVVGLCVKPDDELIMLVVAQVLKDLASSNYLEVCIALTACCKMLNPEVIPCVIQAVQGLQNHNNALVRKKAIMAIHAFYQIDDTSIGADLKCYRNALCDKDPSVMGAALHLLYDFAVNNPEEQRDLVPSFVNILKQVIEHRLSREYDYHRIPAPWIQIKLLKMLSLLVADDQDLSSQCYDVFLETMKRADSGLNIGHAVIYECVKSITSIYPNQECLEAAADAISKFITSSNPNLKYLGITSLSAIVRFDRSYAHVHQALVMECLTDPDETIKRKTLDLLYAMTTEANVEVIVNRLVTFLAKAHDNYLRMDLVTRITELARKFRSDPKWYVNTLNVVIEKDAKHVPDETVQAILKLIAEGEGEDEDEDTEFRKYCVAQYYNRLSVEKIYPDIMYKIIAWVIGEYGFMMENIAPKDQIDRLCDLMERQYQDPETKGWIVTALMKLISQRTDDVFLKEQVTEVLSKYWCSRSTDLQQRSHEYKVLANNPDTFRVALPLDGCCEDIEVDENLTFMDDLINDCVARGFAVYKKKDDAFSAVETGPGLIREAYQAPADIRHAEEMEELENQPSVLEEEATLIIDQSKARWGEKPPTPPPEEQPEEAQEEEAPATLDLPATKGKKKKKKKPTRKELEDKVLFGELKPEELKNMLKSKEQKAKDKEAKRLAKEAKRQARELAEASPRTDSTEGMDSPHVAEAQPEPTLDASPPVQQQTASPRRRAGGAASPRSASPRATQAAGSANLLDDLFGPGTTPTAASATAGGAGKGTDLDDLFAPGGGSPKAAASNMVLATGVTTQKVQLAADQYVKVEFQKVYADSNLAIQFFVTPVTARVTNINMQFQQPANFSMKVESNMSQAAATALSVPALDVAAILTVQVTLGLSDFTFGNQLPGAIQYLDAMNAPHTLQVIAPLLVNDVIRPMGATDTNEFGQLWMAHTCEGKFAKNITNMDVATSLYNVLNVKAIQVIGNEVILVGKVTGVDSLVLVHCMTAPEQKLATITVRSKSKPFTDNVQTHINTYLQ
eukprot:TRINITY_DN59179_c0_g1_i2.p1 TRINITY_DN59179_c0_g1~~TRINITY_DN59179_c0_g1_i2.p1  ORF type:complete len:1115 (+),score=213.75 TRINITY_DN59179_c0_g1_i2:86-3430(+)